MTTKNYWPAIIKSADGKRYFVTNDLYSSLEEAKADHPNIAIVDLALEYPPIALEEPKEREYPKINMRKRK